MSTTNLRAGSTARLIRRRSVLWGFEHRRPVAGSRGRHFATVPTFSRSLIAEAARFDERPLLFSYLRCSPIEMGLVKLETYSSVPLILEIGSVRKRSAKIYLVRFIYIALLT